MGVRPQHGCPWDYMPGVYNTVVQETELAILQRAVAQGSLACAAPGAAPPKRGLDKALATRGKFLTDMKASLTMLLGVRAAPAPPQADLWVEVRTV